TGAKRATPRDRNASRLAGERTCPGGIQQRRDDANRRLVERSATVLGLDRTGIGSRGATRRGRSAEGAGGRRLFLRPSCVAFPQSCSADNCQRKTQRHAADFLGKGTGRAFGARGRNRIGHHTRRRSLLSGDPSAFGGRGWGADRTSPRAAKRDRRSFSSEPSA